MSIRLAERLAEARRSLASLEQAVADLERSRQPSMAADEARQRVRVRLQLIEALSAESARFDELRQILGSAPASDLPIVLLPVRLETRYVPSAAGFDFCLRIYPDDLHIDTHEPELLETELRHGRHFWEEVWRAGPDETRRKAAWAQLAQRFDPSRAAWIARATRPANPQDRPTAAIAPDQRLPVTPQFPQPVLHQESWTRAPVVRTLPDRWCAFGYRGGQRVLITFGEPILDELAAGPSPLAGAQVVPDEQLPLDPGMRWLVDFDEAVRVGMAIRVPLSAEDASRGYDELVVVGLRATLDGSAAAARLAALLDAQHYTDGLAFVAHGTPTNNTPNAPSGFRSHDPGFEASYDAEITTPEAPGEALDNASVMAHALGIDTSVLSQIPGAQDHEQADARAMHTALWPATWGYFLDQMLGEAVSSERVSAIRHLFVEHVRGGGPLPALRIGRQPYGVLPALSLDRWTVGDTDPAQSTLLTVLRQLRKRWRAALARVPRVGRADNAESADADLLELLALEPVSSGFQARSVLDRLMFGTPAIDFFPESLPAHVVQRRQAASDALSELGVEGQPRALDFVLLQSAWPLPGPLISRHAHNPSDRLEPNYVRWLNAATLDEIRQETLPPEMLSAGEKPAALFYLALRHATLQTFVEVAHRIVAGETPAGRTRRHDPSLIGVLEDGDASAWAVFDRTTLLLQDARVGNRIHLLTASDHPAAAALDEFRAALNHLSEQPIANLERLLPETMDCCAHRLDAWITALASDSLARIRGARPHGILLGGYGWVQAIKPNLNRHPVPPPPGESGRIVQEAGSGGFVHAPSLGQAATAAVLRSGYLANRGGSAQPFAIDLSSQRVRHAQWLLDGVRQGQSLAALLGYRFERGLHENHPGVELDTFIEAFRKLAPLSEIYRARGEKDAARENANSLDAAAAGKRTQAAAIVEQANQRLQQLKATRATARNKLTAAQRDVTRFEAEIQKILRPSGGFPQPDPDRERRLAALRSALKKAQAQVSSLETQLERIDRDIASAENEQRTAIGRGDQLNADAAALEVEAGLERARGDAAAAREQVLLAERRELLLLPQSAGTATLESIAIENVVDGLTLHKKYRKALEAASAPRWDADTIPFGKFGLPPTSGPEFDAVVKELSLLAESVDGVSDLVTAESIHQTLLGNSMRVGATLDAVAGGEAPPPQLEVIRTPRSGRAVTHRLALILPDSTSAGDMWPTDSNQVRAIAEPRLNAWAAALLGDPRRILCRADYVVDGTVVGAREIALDALALSPLDFLWMADLGRRSGAGVLEQRLRYAALRDRPGSVSADAQVRLNLGRGPSWGADLLSVDEATTLAAALSELIASSRPLDARDIDLPDAGGPPGVDLTELGTRVDRLMAAFEHAHTRLDVLLSESRTASAEQLRSALLPLLYFDLSTVPVEAAREDGAAVRALLDQAASVLAETAERRRQLQKLLEGVDRTRLEENERLNLESARVATVLGKTFRVVPKFTPQNTESLNQAMSELDVRLVGDVLAPLTWLRRIARVRERGAELNDVFTYAQSLGTLGEPDLQVLQLPHVSGDRWTALPFGTDGSPSQATVSVVLHVPPEFPRPLPPDLAGLMVDEWVEVTPESTEHTGIAFQFDAPASRPPQAILLAVSPGDESQWDIETIESIVVETLELAKLRMVTVAQLDDEISQFLPALYFALNVAGDTISTDFRRGAGGQAL
jgi:hypothetical protein